MSCSLVARFSVPFRRAAAAPLAAAGLLVLGGCGGGEPEATAPDGAGGASQAAVAPQGPEPRPWQRTETGLQYRVLEPGSGELQPRKGDLVRSRFRVYLPGGEPLRHLWSKGAQSMVVGAWIDGWNEAVQLMTAGARHRVRVPPALARAEGAGLFGVPEGSGIVMEIELVAVEPMPRFRSLGAEAASLGPEKAGIRYVWEERGEGEPPAPEDLVRIHVTRWNARGQTLECTHWVGEPVSLLVAKIEIPAVKLAVQRMPEGSVMRLEAPGRVSLPPAQRRPDIARQRFQMVIEMAAIEEPLPVPEFVKPAAEDLQSTRSGLQYQILKPGEGRPPRPRERVRLHFAGWLEDGTLFDDSYSKVDPALLTVEELIPGWREGLQLMKPGAVYRLVVPPELAYGDEGVEDRIPPDATLLFHVELLGIEPPEPDPFASLRQQQQAPEFGLPSGKVQSTPDGLRYQIVRPGGEPTSPVRVRYVAWLADGTRVETTWAGAGVPLSRVPEGVRKAARLVGPGGRVRAVVPPDLAYGAEGRPPLIGPSATLVYVLEVVAPPQSPPR